MNTITSDTAGKMTDRRRRLDAALRQHQGAERRLWRYRLTGWLRRLPEWLLQKSSLAGLVEAQVRARTEQLFRQANYDALTHLPNRAYFTQTIEQTLKDAEGAQAEFALLFLDLDGFKPINDTYGHAAGDELLRLVAARLVSSVRDYDFVARLGGDEFVILLRDVVDQEIIETISRRLITEVSRPYWVNGRSVQVSTSVGITEYPRDGKTVNQLMERADQALYVAKHRGRKQFCFYKDVDALPEAAPDRLQTRFDVDVEHEKLAVHFRPVISLADGRIRSAQLDVAWEGGPEGHVWYEQWKHLLHRSQWNHSVALWMIDNAAWYLSSWSALPEAFTVAVPLDQALLMESEPGALLAERVGRYGVRPQQLVLRVALDAVERLDRKAIEALQSLHEAGFRLALAEVGGLLAHPDHLDGAPLDQLVLSGEWVQRQLASSDGARWLRAVAALGAGLGVPVMADEVRDERQRQLLSRMGVQLGAGEAWQGWLPADAFGRYLQLHAVA